MADRITSEEYFLASSESPIEERPEETPKTKKKYLKVGNTSPVQIITIKCGSNEAKFDLQKFVGVRVNAECIYFANSWMTTNMFRVISGFDKNVQWKKVITHYGEKLMKLEEQGYLILGSKQKHPAPDGCSCRTCCPVCTKEFYLDLFNIYLISFHLNPFFLNLSVILILSLF